MVSKQKKLALCLILSAVFSVKVWATVEGSISGVLTTPEGQKASSVEVQLYGKDGKLIDKKTTTEDGKYRFFPLNLGDYEVRVQNAGFEPAQMQVHVSSGGETQGDLQLNAVSSGEMVVEVKAKRKLVQSSSSVSSSEVNQEKIKQLPQGSEISLPKLITSTTPGVVQGPFGQMFFRGNHGNIQYQIDGVQMPESPSNTFGQAFSPRNIDHMEVITGGIPAEYGQRLGAVVNIVTKTGPENPGGEVELNYGSYNTISPHVLYGGSTPSGDLHYFLSLNYNRTDRGIDTPQPKGTDNQSQGGKDAVHDVAYGNSEFGKVDWQINNTDKLTFTVFNSQNKFQIPNYPSTFRPGTSFFTDPDQFGNEGEPHGAPTFNYVPSDTDDTQAETNTYGQVVWKHTFSEKAFLQFAPYYKYSSITVTNDPSNDLYTSASGAYPVANAQPTSFALDRQTHNLGMKTDYTHRLHEVVLMKTGFQLQASRSTGMLSIQRDLNGTVFSDSSPTNGYYESVYNQYQVSLAKSLTLNLGLRFDATQFAFSGLSTSDYLFQPRTGLTWMATDTTRFHIFYGKLFQPAAAENLRTTFNYVQQSPQPYDIKAEKDDYYEAGVAQQIFNQVLSVNGYYRDATDMLDDAQLLNTSMSQPYNFGKGYAYGVEASLKGPIYGDWSEFINYSYGIAKGNDVISGGAWAAEQPHSSGYSYLDHVQFHTATAGVTYATQWFWWTTQGLYGSGLRTGHDKSASLPAHITFDTTVGYEFHGKSWFSQFRLSGDVLNIFDNVYPITIANGYNGSHYAPGRQFFIRIAKSF